MRFFKMQNCGNDYIFVFNRPTQEEVIRLCNRNFGIGGDGVVYLYKKKDTFGYEIYNSDGSRATFCGSVTLCLGLYLYAVKKGKSFDVLTDSGVKRVSVFPRGKKVKVGVEVGKPHFQEPIGNQKIFNKLLFLRFGGKTLRVRATLVNVGNLHLVIKGLYSIHLREKIVNAINESGTFPGGVNVEFVERRKRYAKVIVYERGSGKTLCCSSGGGAVFAVLNKTGACGENFILEFEGGKIVAQMKNKSIFIYSYPRFLFSGEWGGLCE